MSGPGAGLDEAEAARRLAQFGPNELPRPRPRGVAAIVASTLREPMFLLLLAATALYLLLGDLGEGLFLAAGAAVAIGLVVFQEARSERALAALRELAEPLARVLRDGEPRRVPSRDLVPGDLLLVGEGERLPADALLREGDVLTVDESILTGESAPVTRSPDPGATEAVLEQPAGGDGGAALFAGTLVARGHGTAEVTRTGARTALGRIGASLARIEEAPTPLQRTAGRLVALLGVLALGFCVVVALAYGLLRGDWIEAALAGLTVAIALIPEEFPMVLAVFLALGAWRLARHRVLVRRAAVIEALGGATILCVDKTGTLTENRMTLDRLWAGGAEHPAAAGGAAAPGLVEAAVLASAARSADPMDRAVTALYGGPDGPQAGRRLKRTWPLRPGRMAMVQLWGDGDGDLAAAKGAPEAILKLCRMDGAEAAAVRGALDTLAAEGLRVLAVAACRCPAFAGEPEDGDFRFAGLLGFLDPLRADVPAALAEARGAGIAVAMVTGDYPATALEIARRAGVDTAPGVLTGAEIAELAPDALRARVGEVRVFARVAPAQKLRLVEALKANGEVVAMTGDGVNDGPALEAADIGIAMGRRGSDVAREAADLVLLDDSFASIVGGVRLGRRIFANLRKALTYITAVHVPIAGLALLPVVMGLPPLLFPMHVVLLELVVDPMCSLVFEAEPSAPGAMKRPPRRRHEALFGPREIAVAAAQGLAVLAAVLALYVWALQLGDEAQARAAAFASLVTANLALALSDSIAPGIGLFDRRRLTFWIITGAAGLVVAASLYAPGLGDIFSFAPPPPVATLAAAAAGLVAGGVFGVGIRWLAGVARGGGAQPSRRLALEPSALRRRGPS